MSKPKSKKIAFIHPDLGIGGAERLVVDAAVGLQELGNNITVYTSHCDKTHCFEEVSNDILKVEVYGDFFPTHVFKKFHILFAIIRQFYLVIKLILTGEILKYDYFIVDQLSFAVPILHLFSKADSRILFYCHFPDQLLSKKGGLIKQLYRIPFNFIEEWSTGVSDKIIVNSKFTKGIFRETFTGLDEIEPGVIYPCVDIKAGSNFSKEDKASDVELEEFIKGNKYFLSINRFERTKNISLAIKAFALFKSKNLTDGSPKSDPKLIVAGGYDARVNENAEYLQELTSLCDELKLKNFTVRGKLIVMPPSTDVLFLPSIKSTLKNSLIKKAELLLYTPGFEHFGIVPVESMLFKTPVLAVNHGGPLESIINFNGSNINEATGYNRPPDENIWSEVLFDYYNKLSNETKLKLGENSLKRVNKIFSREQMSASFSQYLKEADRLSESKGFLKKIFAIWPLYFVVTIFAIISYQIKNMDINR